VTRKLRDHRLDSDPDFIIAPRHDNSLKRLMNDNPDGVPDTAICKALDLSKEELQNIYDSAILKLRRAMTGFADDQDDI
jgi:hypothetical protein